MAVSSNWKNLKSFLRKAYNREVNEWFKDIASSTPDNSTARNQAKRACLVLPSESQSMALIKMLAFRFTVQRVHLRPHVYGTPIGTIDAQRAHRPQIVLEFLEDEADVDLGYSKIDGRISFRLMNETSTTIDKTDLTAIANKVKNEFGLNKGFVWKKGKDLASYVDKAKGYQFQLLVKSKTDAKEIVEKVLNLQNDTPNWDRLSYKESDNPTGAYPTLPGNINILTKTYKKPRVRPIASVRFQYAYCSLWGNPNPIILYDRSLTFFDTLVQ